MSQTKLVLQKFKNKNLVEGVAWVLDQAMRGEISGACFVIKHNRFKHSIGIVGEYRNDPMCALRPLKRLEATINTLAEEMETHVEMELVS